MLLTRTKRSEHITPILRSLHWLPVRPIYRIVFKALNGIGPYYIHDMFTQHNQARSLRSQNKNLLVQTTAKTKCGESAFSVYAAKLWTKLPEEIKKESRNYGTTCIFKSKLKAKLFSDAYY